MIWVEHLCEDTGISSTRSTFLGMPCLFPLRHSEVEGEGQDGQPPVGEWWQNRCFLPERKIKAQSPAAPPRLPLSPPAPLDLARPIACPGWRKHAEEIPSVRYGLTPPPRTI